MSEIKKIALLGKTPEELLEIVLSLGLPKFTAKQISDWLYKKKIWTVDDMTNLSKIARERLSEKHEIGLVNPIEQQQSSDGTKKYLFPYFDTSSTEAVMIPDEDRYTLCVSSQAGCKMGCVFCMTGKQGFTGNMTVAQILSQFYTIDEASILTNAVFMGMGEPLDNLRNVLKSIEVLTADWGFGWSPKRITLSSIGILPALKEFLDSTKVHIAISLHSPFENERLNLMPAQKAFPLSQIIDLIKTYDFTGQRRVSFEYIMFEGFNDTKRHADTLARILRGLESRVNLIRFHKIPDSDLRPSSDLVMENFRHRLNDAGVTATIRTSRGEDILAACGMLAGKTHNK